MSTSLPTSFKPSLHVTTPQLPLRTLGFKNVPAVPVGIPGMVDTLLKLGVRTKQYEQALQGLSKTFTIGGSTAPAYTFLFGREAADTKAAAAHERLRGLAETSSAAPSPLSSTTFKRRCCAIGPSRMQEGSCHDAEFCALQPRR